MLTYLGLVLAGIASLLWISSVRDRRRHQSDAAYFRRHLIQLERKGGIE